MKAVELEINADPKEITQGINWWTFIFGFAAGFILMFIQRFGLLLFHLP